MNIAQAQSDFAAEISQIEAGSLHEEQEAIIFAKILIRQQIYNSHMITFCRDNEIFVSKSPAGYAITGYYLSEGKKIPFQITVCKINGLWYPAKQYDAPDTKSCSGYIGLWVLISLGCTLMGIVMYFLISAAVEL